MFDRNREELEEWLCEKTDEGSKARVIGYEQGGAQAIFAVTEYPGYFDTDQNINPSYACSTLGVNRNHLNLWNSIKKDEKPGLIATFTAKDPKTMPFAGESLVIKSGFLRISCAKGLSSTKLAPKKALEETKNMKKTHMRIPRSSKTCLIINTVIPTILGITFH